MSPNFCFFLSFCAFVCICMHAREYMCESHINCSVSQNKFFFRLSSSSFFSYSIQYTINAMCLLCSKSHAGRLEMENLFIYFDQIKLFTTNNVLIHFEAVAVAAKKTIFFMFTCCECFFLQPCCILRHTYTSYNVFSFNFLHAFITKTREFVFVPFMILFNLH